MFSREHLSRVATRAAAGLVAIGALAALASCGGGTYQVSTFAPVRMLSFGDESSRLEGAQGRQGWQWVAHGGSYSEIFSLISRLLLDFHEGF